LRSGIADNELKEILLKAFDHRAKDGWEAQRLRIFDPGIHESMATIGG